MDVVIVFILALTEIRTPQSDKVKLPRGDRPVEHLRFLRVQQGPISSQRAAPRACLSLVWAAACLGRPRCLRKSLCPNSPLPPELPPCALPECSHLPLLLEPQNDGDKLYLSPSRCYRYLGNAPIILSVAWTGGGGAVSFSASFSIPSRAPQQWASCHPSRRELPCPQDPVGAFGLTWSYQAEINWAEYLWPCLLGRAVSGCAQFRKLIKRREKWRNRCFWVVCVHTHMHVIENNLILYIQVFYEDLINSNINW